MSVQLLDNTRKISRFIQTNTANVIDFTQLCEVLSSILRARVVIVSRKGKVLGLAGVDEVPMLGDLLPEEVGGHCPSELNDRFLGILSTKENVNLETLGFRNTEGMFGIVLPLISSGERYGTAFLYRTSAMFGIDDIILSELAANILALELIRAENAEEDEARRMQESVDHVVDAMSTSELRAVDALFEELGERREGIVVASKVADRIGVTRSVVVTSLRKLEGATVIDCRSSGMRGTYIRVINDRIFPALEARKK